MILHYAIFRVTNYTSTASPRALSLVSGEAFSFREQMLTPYSRPPIDISKQIEHLKNRGLKITCDSGARKHLEEKGYYRLKAYMLPYRGADREFIEGTALEQVIALHDFDEKLRLAVFKHIQRVEIFVRNNFNEYMCAATENAFWYLDSSLFGRNTASYADTINKMRASFLNSQEAFARHFREQYYNEFCSFYSLMPPSWMVVELMTFGNMLTLLNSVSTETIERHKLDRWSRKNIGPDKFKKLTNWLHCVRDVRNHCAHHNRLFNRNFTAPDGIKRQFDKSIELVKLPHTNPTQYQLNRLYTALAALQTISKRAGLTSIGPELVELFGQHPEANQHLPSMGFPSDWRKESLFF